MGLDTLPYTSITVCILSQDHLSDALLFQTEKPEFPRAADLRPAPAGGRGAFVFVSDTSCVLTCV